MKLNKITFEQYYVSLSRRKRNVEDRLINCTDKILVECLNTLKNEIEYEMKIIENIIYYNMRGDDKNAEEILGRTKTK